MSQFEEPYGLLTFEAPKELNLKVMQFLFDDAELRFQFLTDLTAVHYPDQPGRELAVVYHLHNLVDNIRLRFKVFTAIEQPDIFTARNSIPLRTGWSGRRMISIGINFVGHPNLKRILNVDEMEYFPMRKEFPLEDQTRIDKDDAMFGRGPLPAAANSGEPDRDGRRHPDEPTVPAHAGTPRTLMEGREAWTGAPNTSDRRRSVEIQGASQGC